MGAPPHSPILKSMFRPSMRVAAVLGLFLLSLSWRASAQDPLARQISSGPWGTIESYEVVLEPPRSQLWEALYDERSVWNFGNLEKGQVLELFRQFEFSPQLMALIDEQGIWTQTAEGINLEFNDAIVEATTAANRTNLARWFRINNNAFFRKNLSNIEGHNLEILRKRLSPEQYKLVEEVAFNRGEVVSLLDRPYLLRKMEGDKEAKQDLVRSIFSTHSLIVKLRVSETSDVEALTKYWSGNGRNPRVRAILEGVQSTEGVDSVDIVQLLPPLPRKYLYGFAKVDDVFPQNAPDCFWTSVQFFRPVPSPRLLDTLSMNHYLDDDFTLVYGEPAYGDMVCLFRAEDDQFVHSYVHIADDIVFSKNGSSFTRPWILTRKSRMMSVYIDEDALITRVFRPKQSQY